MAWGLNRERSCLSCPLSSPGRSAWRPGHGGLPPGGAPYACSRGFRGPGPRRELRGASVALWRFEALSIGPSPSSSPRWRPWRRIGIEDPGATGAALCCPIWTGCPCRFTILSYFLALISPGPAPRGLRPWEGCRKRPASGSRRYAELGLRVRKRGALRRVDTPKASIHAALLPRTGFGAAASGAIAQLGERLHACRRSAVRSRLAPPTPENAAPAAFFCSSRQPGSGWAAAPIEGSVWQALLGLQSIYMNRTLGWWRGQHWRGLAPSWRMVCVFTCCERGEVIFPPCCQINASYGRNFPQILN